MKITREMVMELNNELAVKGCPFRYEYEGATEYSHIPQMQVALPNMNCVSSCIINVTRDFLEWLELWFKTKYGIELTCNNDGSILWAKNYREYLDIERDCDHYSPMTNADRIRSMTDEELADFLVTVETYGYHDQSISGTYEMNEWLRAESEEKHGE